jgi:group I intron endonuclease
MYAGVYTITSPSGGFYVGSASRFSDRWSLHRRDLRAGVHHNQPLQRAWNKYGEDQMVFAKIIICDKKNLLLYEQAAIDALQPSYNILRKAGSHAGAKRSPESVERIRLAQTGRKASLEARQRMSEAGFNRPPVSDETRAKMSAARRGKPLSESARAKVAAAQTGLKHSPERIARNAELRRGVKQSAETIEKRTAPLRGKKRPEQSEKLREYWRKKKAAA